MVNNQPHGGELVNRVVDEKERKNLEKYARSLKYIFLEDVEISDVYMVALGCFSPLKGFMIEKDYRSVLDEMRLSNGLVWSIPIVLSLEESEVKQIEKEKEIALRDSYGNYLGIMEVAQIYRYNKEEYAEKVYGTLEEKHPGVVYLLQQGDYFLGGNIMMLKEPYHDEFSAYWFSPQEAREVFAERGWKKVVGFQTRNPIHRAHEFIIKTALEIVDGLFLNPLVGKTKKGDIPANVRMRCYEVLIDKYFPKERVFIGVYGAAMRYAGPREAILHALVRKNFGCTHFIVGRDHAGVGNYYAPFDAQRIFDNFEPEEIGITPLCFDNAFFCRKCQGMATKKTCPHSPEAHLSFSGTQVRELLKAGQIPPPEFTRPEIANILIDWYQKERSQT